MTLKNIPAILIFVPYTICEGLISPPSRIAVRSPNSKVGNSCDQFGELPRKLFLKFYVISLLSRLTADGNWSFVRSFFNPSSFDKDEKRFDSN